MVTVLLRGLKSPDAALRNTLLGYLQLFGALVVLIAIGEIPAVRAFSDWVNLHRSTLLTLTLSATALGFVVMIWGWTVTAIEHGRSMTPEEAEEFMGHPLATPGHQSFGKGRFRGVARGRQTDGPVEWSFQEMKTAWRAGSWWTDSGMRRKFLITVGGVWLILSGFSVFLVSLRPPAAKVMIASAILYAVARTYGAARRAGA